MRCSRILGEKAAVSWLKSWMWPLYAQRVLKGTNRITPEMALRLSKGLGRSPESWLAMQDAHAGCP